MTITATELRDLIDQHAAAAQRLKEIEDGIAEGEEFTTTEAAYDAAHGAALERRDASATRIYDARPAEPAGLAILIRWVKEQKALRPFGTDFRYLPILDHAADRLEAMA